ncbi:MAG: TRAP transporter TatT component family protein [Candidatus Deferrimicrobiaceae bacterium]
MEAAFALLILVFSVGCSPRAYVLGRVADGISAGGEVFASDDDPELVREAVPFALKAEEALLEQQPDHRGLLASLCRGFTQYATAFVWQDAVEEEDPNRALAGKERARRLLQRAKEYGMRGLEVAHPGFHQRLFIDPMEAAVMAGKEDVPLLYWTAASWSLDISLSGGDPHMLADLPRCESLMRRALALQEDYDHGAIHEYFVAFDGGRPEAMGGSLDEARRHFARAMELGGGRKISPLVTFAETVSVRTQARGEFLELLSQALAFDARRETPEFRLANLLAQRKANWLLGRVDELFLE